MCYKKTPEVHSPTPCLETSALHHHAGLEAWANRKVLSEVARALFITSCSVHFASTSGLKKIMYMDEYSYACASCNFPRRSCWVSVGTACLSLHLIPETTSDRFETVLSLLSSCPESCLLGTESETEKRRSCP